MTPATAFRVLGPLRVTQDGRPVSVPAGRLSALLALLLVRVNQVVPAEDLIDRLWAEGPPVDPRRTLHLYIARLRRALGPAGAGMVRTDGTGYVVRASADTLDLLRFTELVRRAEAAGDDEDRSTLLAEALALWRRPVLGNVQVDALRADTERLEELWAHTMERRIEVDLVLGRHREVVAELLTLVERLPLRERLWAQLMTALYRCGRQADALANYQRVRDRLADDLGVDPGSELQELHQRILTADPALAAPPAATAVRTVPAQLPADSATFTGRGAELDHLLARPRDAGTAVVISAVDGMAGVGKTALAVHAAHRLVPGFPDGQVFLDLHGFTDGIPPVDPADALDRLLRALGVRAGQIPKNLEDRAALYRSTLAGTRTLVVLDNAATEEQVRPLLPGAPGCLVLVTSRRRLSGLDTAGTLSLDLLPPADATTLFTTLTGAPAGLAAEIVELCGRLPLAIRVAAARLRSHPAWTTGDLAERMRDHENRLSELDSGRPGVAAALELSYQDLDSDRRRAYRLIGTVAGPDIDLAAASALVGTTARRTGLLLEDLLDMHLLTEPMPGRYQFHDLVRAHAVAVANRDEPEPERTAALRRLLDHYVQRARAAVGALYPDGERPGPAPDAAAWLDTEMPNMVAAAQRGVELDLPAPVTALFTVLHRHLTVRGQFTEGHALATAALTVARSAGDAAGEVRALGKLGNIDRMRGWYETAADSARRALDLARRILDRPGELGALTDLAYIHMMQGRPGPAGECLGRALDISRDLGDRHGEQTVLTALGGLDRLQGRYQSATDHLELALDLARALGDREREINALNGLGYLHRDQGHYRWATECLARARDLAREIGDSVGEAQAVFILGHLARMQGEHGSALDLFESAVTLARDLGHRIALIHSQAGLGDVHRLMGHHDLAADHYRRALRLAREAGERNGEFEALVGLGEVHLARNGAGDALTHFAQALEVAERLEQPSDQARAHDGLARTHDRTGCRGRAENHWRRVVTILTDHEIDHADGIDLTAIRARLEGPTTAGALGP